MQRVSEDRAFERKEPAIVNSKRVVDIPGGVLNGRAPRIARDVDRHQAANDYAHQGSRRPGVSDRCARFGVRDRPSAVSSIDFPDDEGWPPLRFEVGATHVFSDDAKADELQAAEKHDRSEDGGVARYVHAEIGGTKRDPAAVRQGN